MFLNVQFDVIDYLWFKNKNGGFPAFDLEVNTSYLVILSHALSSKNQGDD